ncbi:MAG TPA: Wzt carbohydrate-binding domain-containing protein [Bryobacteraceae bacterium]|nr:Wzt carbohydrate-binding domain-containing protein [Bryobacteraceae bacterium]
MAIEFRGVEFAPLRNLTVSGPNGAVIGVVGLSGAGKTALLRLAADLDRPAAGDVVFEGKRRWLGPCDALDLSPIDLLLMDQTLAQQDALARAKALVGIDRLRSEGATVLVVSHEADLLRRLCDEVWWLDQGKLAGRGDPGEVLDAYQQHVAEQFRAWGETLPSPMRLALRRGDGRAEILKLETLGDGGRASVVWRSGEPVAVHVRVRYREEVEEPVIGIMIRTRIGLNVYGTNTELERKKTGRFSGGDQMDAVFRFRCELCPGEYTLTAASHDPDGTAHDWIDNAVAFVVTDSRYTAGVANLRASVELEKSQA